VSTDLFSTSHRRIDLLMLREWPQFPGSRVPQSKLFLSDLASKSSHAGSGDPHRPIVADAQGSSSFLAGAAPVPKFTCQSIVE